MSNSIGRNEPCPCGSGKKYKKCCLAKLAQSTNNSEVGISDFAWHKLRQIEATVIDKHLAPYVDQISKKSSYDVVITEVSSFFPEDLPVTFDKDLLFKQLFIPWFLFNWIPFEDFGISDFDEEKTIAENYLKSHSKDLGSDELKFMEAMNKTYYSFYTVIAVEHGKSLTIKDILLGKTHKIKERSGTQYLKRGDIILSRILMLDEQSIFVGMAPYSIPVEYGNTLINFKNWLIEANDCKKLTSELLRDNDYEIIEFFFEAIIISYDRRLPILYNTDGELIQFSKSYFKLTLGIEEVFKKLLPLTLSKDQDEFLEDASRDESGVVKSIEFPWLKKGNKKNKDWDNTVMATIKIEQGRLILESNSMERTEKGKELLFKYLGTDISFQQTLIESPDQKFNSLAESTNKHRHKNESQAYHGKDLLELPEVQEQIKQMTKAHWDNWFTEPIPALNNQTPREASKTKAGKEMLEALLLEYERHHLERTDNLLTVDIKYLRKELGLKIAT
jgi:hypothetical protein